MRESFAVIRLPASSDGGTRGNRRSPKSFGKVARALWPNKTAAELAYRARVTERAAKYWLAGKRKPSMAAVSAIVAEIME
jgi:hypothetical protein